MSKPQPAFEPPNNRVRIQTALLEWYRAHRRELPWRRDADPYAVWVSEMMLQQTQVATVVPFFERWLKLFPDVNSLAQASEADVLHAWQGLGYYSRARNLLKGARAVVERHQGHVPSDIQALRDLPGVGPYTAGAIASIAHGKPEPIVDGNVIRVLSRVYALAGNPTRAEPQRKLWALAESLVPAEAPGDFNQALMELGATRCTPKKPACVSCPIADACLARAQGRVEQYPELPVRPKVTQVAMLAAVVWRDQRVLVGKLRAEAPRWAGMWQFPNAEHDPVSQSSEQGVRQLIQVQTGLVADVRGLLCVVRHSVTRYRITLDAYTCDGSSGPETAGGEFERLRWVAPAELATLALPKAHASIAKRLLEQD